MPNSPGLFDSKSTNHARAFGPGPTSPKLREAGLSGRKFYGAEGGGGEDRQPGFGVGGLSTFGFKVSE